MSSLARAWTTAGHDYSSRSGRTHLAAPGLGWNGRAGLAPVQDKTRRFVCFWRTAVFGQPQRFSSPVVVSISSCWCAAASSRAQPGWQRMSCSLPADAIGRPKGGISTVRNTVILYRAARGSAQVLVPAPTWPAPKVQPWNLAHVRACSTAGTGAAANAWLTQFVNDSGPFLAQGRILLVQGSQTLVEYMAEQRLAKSRGSGHGRPFVTDDRTGAEVQAGLCLCLEASYPSGPNDM